MDRLKAANRGRVDGRLGPGSPGCPAADRPPWEASTGLGGGGLGTQWRHQIHWQSGPWHTLFWELLLVSRAVDATVTVTPSDTGCRAVPSTLACQCVVIQGPTPGHLRPPDARPAAQQWWCLTLPEPVWPASSFAKTWNWEFRPNRGRWPWWSADP